MYKYKFIVYLVINFILGVLKISDIKNYFSTIILA